MSGKNKTSKGIENSYFHVRLEFNSELEKFLFRKSYVFIFISRFYCEYLSRFQLSLIVPIFVVYILM